MNIVRQRFFLAKDDEGNYYPLINWKSGEYSEMIEHVDVDGEIVDEEIKDENGKVIATQKKFKIK